MTDPIRPLPRRLKALTPRRRLVMSAASALLMLGAATVPAGPARADRVENVVGASGTSSSGARVRVGGCVGSSFSGTLGNQQAICNGKYLVRMQGNGDLVLRVISTGRACWHSATAGAWSNDASATFVKFSGGIGPPHVRIDKTSQGTLRKLFGAHHLLGFGTNASVNANGEFWIGYKRIANC